MHCINLPVAYIQVLHIAPVVSFEATLLEPRLAPSPSSAAIRLSSSVPGKRNLGAWPCIRACTALLR